MMNNVIYQSESLEETMSFAAEMATSISHGTVIALIGDLGTGKTAFSQGFAWGLGIKDFVNSPTFKLVSQYDRLDGHLYHVDCYRLDGPQDFINIGGENFLYPLEGITLIEWANIIEEIIPSNSIWIRFSRNPDFPERRILAINGWKK